MPGDDERCRSRPPAPSHEHNSRTRVLDAAHAHEYGLGISQLEVRRATRAVLRSINFTALIERAAERVVQQAIAEALPIYWLRRAEELELAGTATADALAQSCRRHAWLLAEGR